MRVSCVWVSGVCVCVCLYVNVSCTRFNFERISCGSIVALCEFMRVASVLFIQYNGKLVLVLFAE